jgi:hypothetical protein
VVLLVAALLLLPGGTLFASGTVDKGGIRPPWDEGITYLLKALKHRDAAFDARKVTGLLDFVLSEKGGDAGLTPGKRDNATGVYFLTDVKVPLARVIQYAYNPDVPSSLTVPSVVRFSGWHNKPTGPFANLWERLGNVKDPLVIRGTEYEEITPDLTMGAYYRYDMDRLLILLNHRGRDVLISVARQQNPSSIGRKGAIIGPDRDWNYFYSGQKGLSKTGFGWVSSYMYDAFSVSLFFEPDGNQPLTRNATFKWLNAGWGGINMVKPENILEGCRRFAAGFKKVLESPLLPAPGELAERFARIRGLSDRELETRLQPIAASLQKLARTDPALNRRDFQEIIDSGQYPLGMSRQEREHLLLSESLKLALDKPALLDQAL